MNRVQNLGSLSQIPLKRQNATLHLNQNSQPPSLVSQSLVPETEIVPSQTPFPQNGEDVEEKNLHSLDSSLQVTSAQASTSTTTTSNVKVKVPGEKKETIIDFEDDVLRRIKKEMGLMKFLPLSVGKLVDLWWKPFELEFVPGRQDMHGNQLLNVHVQVLYDTCPFMTNPFGKDISVAFRTDATEIERLAYLYSGIKDEMEGRSYIKNFCEWRNMMIDKFGYDESISGNESEFAKAIFDEVFKTPIRDVPSTFQVFFTKKTSSTIILPAGCPHAINRNSIGITTSNGFRFEYRARVFLLHQIEVEDIDEGKEE